MVFLKKDNEFFNKVAKLFFKDQFDLNVIRKRKASGEPLIDGGLFVISITRLKELQSRGLLKGL